MSLVMVSLLTDLVNHRHQGTSGCMCMDQLWGILVIVHKGHLLKFTTY